VNDTSGGGADALDEEHPADTSAPAPVAMPASKLFFTGHSFQQLGDASEETHITDHAPKTGLSHDRALSIDREVFSQDGSTLAGLRRGPACRTLVDLRTLQWPSVPGRRQPASSASVDASRWSDESPTADTYRHARTLARQIGSQRTLSGVTLAATSAL
jgi:hypothetical protein